MAMPICLPQDKNGRVVQKFLDAFETVRFDMTGEPKYYGDQHPDGPFVIRRHETLSGGDEHIAFYYGDGTSTLTATWANRAALTYVEYEALY